MASLYRDLKRMRHLMGVKGLLPWAAIEHIAGVDTPRGKAIKDAVSDQFPMAPFSPIPSSMVMVERAIKAAEERIFLLSD